ncbi:MAG: ATP-binding protein [Candidatus Melainabacteria bacterium]|jgi:uncharacterized protein|nr:ATP-binding protein [Candidatus Melainabacteria bacterium]
MQQDKILKIIQEWQEEILLSAGIERYSENKIIKSLNSQPIKIITGFRRSGKSYLCKRIANKLQQNKYPLPNILYLNFEDYKLNWANSVEKLGDIYEVFLRFSVDSQKPILLIFDELQKIPNWESFIRTIYEKSNAPQIIITGSNSDLLSSEISSSLSGRFIEFFLLPFSFQEYLSFHNINCDYHTRPKKLTDDFYKYLKLGGLPELYNIDDPETRKSFIQGIISKVMLDDVIKRFAIRNQTALELILKFVLANNGRIISYAKITKHLKNLNIKIQDETVIEYIDYLKKSFTLLEVEKFDWSTKKIFSGSKKYYSIDIGISNQFRDLISNFSFNLENLVLLKLKQNPSTKKIYYGYADNKELDFITEDYDGKLARYQISKELNEENTTRELEAFLVSDKFIKQSPATMLVLDGITRDIEYKSSKIKQINLIEWLLS